MSIPSWAVKGAKVVCIRTAAPEARLLGANYPGVDQVYTIRAVVIVTFGEDAGEVGLLLEEVVNSADINPQIGGYSEREPCLPLDAFRPVAPQRTEAEDVAMIKDLIGLNTEERV